MVEATSATEKDVAEGSGAPSPGEPGADGQLTDAQKAQQAQQGDAPAVNPVDGTPLQPEGQQEQYQQDQQARIDSGYEAVGREANPEFGGESFGYGPAKSAAEAAQSE
jgi:hypothetical protein